MSGSALPARPMSGHLYTTRVYYADTDAGGVVYHGTYLAMAERARTEALRAAGLPHEEMRRDHDCIFMVRRVNLEYLRPARLDDMLTITTTRTAETGATISLRQVFALPDDGVAASAELLLACVRASTGRPARIPPRWRQIPL